VLPPAIILLADMPQRRSEVASYIWKEPFLARESSHDQTAKEHLRLAQ
jgi:hypothetical protein